ncbi:MAG TPA: NAD(FAD)-dependent dehydrogenase, partial [candidate division Zixibacteria bacterium]|nr:NAD(FAD)-dependent dehydrogenase [candidate division Zixibacteria bacterium]
LASFEVKIEGDDIYVMIPEEFKGSRTPDMVSYDPGSENRSFVIIGAGAAGSMAAQTLREDGFKGQVIMLTHEDRMPYDRPNLSKDYLQGDAKEEWMPIRDDDFYNKYGIEVLRKKHVTGIDIKNREVSVASGDSIKYDRLLITTGGEPRKLDIPGADLQNVFTLRSYDDCDRIIAAAENASKVVVIGASFIGMETAFSLTKRKLKVTVAAPEKTPFSHVFAAEVGELFRKKHEDIGVQFRLGESVTEIEGDGKVKAVVLESGDRIEADMVIMGVGVKPSSEFLKGLELESDGSLKVDEYFNVTEDVFAAGDIASFPYWYNGDIIRIEHWRTAEQQGRYAAHNMLDKDKPFRSIPFFWTAQVGLQFRHVGYVRDWEDVIVKGDVSKGSFLLFYVKNNRVQAASGIKYDKEIDAVEELMRRDRMPSADELKDGSIDLLELVRK